MSLMLNALKRIEAKQAFVPSRQSARPAASSSAVGIAEPIEVPPELPCDVLPGMLEDDFALPEPVSLEAMMDQLQTLVSEADSFCDEEPESLADDDDLPVVMPVASDPYAATAQQILHRLPHGRSQVLLFTGPTDGQGKTMTLARLAPLLAQGLEGHVLVVDANFRNPEMARWLNVAPAWRLPDVLAGVADWAAAVQPTGRPGVSLLPGGTELPGRISGGKGRGAGQLFRDLAGHYDLVVVDGPSLVHRGTAPLAAFCDATYLVARLGEEVPRLLREAVQVIQQCGGRLAGCVAVS